MSAAQVRLDMHEQLTRVEGLGHIVVPTSGEPNALVNDIAFAERKITGTVTPRVRNSRHVANPSIRGIMTSRITRSNDAFSECLKASVRLRHRRIHDPHLQTIRL